VPKLKYGANTETAPPAVRYRGMYSAVARHCGVSRQYVWQVVHGQRHDARIGRAIKQAEARRLPQRGSFKKSTSANG